VVPAASIRGVVDQPGSFTTDPRHPAADMPSAQEGRVAVISRRRHHPRSRQATPPQPEDNRDAPRPRLPPPPRPQRETRQGENPGTPCGRRGPRRAPRDESRSAHTTGAAPRSEAATRVANQHRLRLRQTHSVAGTASGRREGRVWRRLDVPVARPRSTGRVGAAKLVERSACSSPAWAEGTRIYRSSYEARRAAGARGNGTPRLAALADAFRRRAGSSA